jgi:hypothetical protein
MFRGEVASLRDAEKDKVDPHGQRHVERSAAKPYTRDCGAKAENISDYHFQGHRKK